MIKIVSFAILFSSLSWFRTECTVINISKVDVELLRLKIIYHIHKECSQEGNNIHSLPLCKSLGVLAEQLEKLSKRETTLLGNLLVPVIVALESEVSSKKDAAGASLAELKVVTQATDAETLEMIESLISQLKNQQQMDSAAVDRKIKEILKKRNAKG